VSQFLRRWDTFQVGSGITDAAALGQLLECTGEHLGNVVLCAHPDFTSRTLQEVLVFLKSIAVIPVALGSFDQTWLLCDRTPTSHFTLLLHRYKVRLRRASSRQSLTKPVLTAPHLSPERYTMQTRYALLNGIADLDIRREALSTNQIQIKQITDVIAFVESKEIARNTNSTSAVSSLSEYSRSSCDTTHQRLRLRPCTQSPTGFDQSLTAKCPDCSTTFNLYTKKAQGWNHLPPIHTRCKGCWKKSRVSAKQTGTTGSISHSIDNTFGQISSTHTDTSSAPGSLYKKAPPKILDHQIFSKGQWRLTRHLKVTLGLALETLPSKCNEVITVTDTGANLICGPWTHFSVLGSKWRTSPRLLCL